jgi:hypothetical protein
MKRLMNEKPPLTLMIGYLTLIISIVLIVWGVWMCFNPSDGMQMLVDTVSSLGITLSLEDAAIVGGFSLIGMGIVAIAIVMIGMGHLLKGRKIMWFVAIILYLSSFIPCLYTLVTSIGNGDGVGPAGPLPVVVSVLVVLYLLRPEVKENYGF